MAAEFDSKLKPGTGVEAPKVNQDQGLETKPVAPLSALSTHTKVNLLSASAENAKSLGLQEGWDPLLNARFSVVNPDLLKQVNGLLHNEPGKRLERIVSQFDLNNLSSDGGRSFFTNSDVQTLAAMSGAATEKLRTIIATANKRGEITSAYETFKKSAADSIPNLDRLLKAA